MAKTGFVSAVSNVVPQIVMCLMMLGISAHFTITQLMLLGKVCLSQFDKQVCNDLALHEEVENVVQTETTRLNTNIQLLSMLPAGFVTLILGPLSDIYGRKQILLFPTVTTVFFAVCLLYQSVSTDVSTSVLYLGALIWGLGGGIGAFMSSVINYVIDATPEEQRTEKLSAVMPFFMIGQTIGGLSSGIVAEYKGTNSVYGIFLIAAIFTVFFIVVFMEDKRVASKAEKKDLSLQMIYGNLTAGGKTLVAPRPGTQRFQLIILTFVTAVLCMACMAADMSILPLYVSRTPLSWTPLTLSYQNALKTIMMVVGQVGLTPLLLKMSGTKGIVGDFTLVCVGLVAGGSVSAIHALAESTWVMMIIVPVIVMFAGPGQPAISSLTSKLVRPSETGALTGFSSFLNSLSLPIGTVIFSQLYSSTIQSMPSATFLTTAGLNFLGLLLIMYARSYAIDEMKLSDDRKES